MSLKRRHFLMFLGSTASYVAFQPLLQGCSDPATTSAGSQTEVISSTAGGQPFQPVRGPMPLAIDPVESTKQTSDYSQYTVVDDVVLPEGFTYNVIASWGDPVGDSRFGYNNDYLSFVETAPGEGFLTVNFEYISGLPWTQTFGQVIGQALPLAAVQAAIPTNGGIDAFTLANDDPLKGQIREICKQALIDVGLGVISIRREADGRWVRTSSPADRRITGISGLEDGRYLKATGPATTVFRKTQGVGYLDGLGDRIIGSFANCAGGTTPWGTVFSAEENFQTLVPESVYADGTAFAPSRKTFYVSEEEIFGAANVFGLAGNKYGWMVEVDPANPNDYGTKHTWLGRYRHEAVGIRAEANRKLAVYSGCDRRGGHLYKFISNDSVTDPKDKANSRLLENGMLYAAQFNPDGTGRWIPLTLDTPVNPNSPGVHIDKMITLPEPNRALGGMVGVRDDALIASYRQQFKTLADLYVGTPEEKQGAILIDAHYAANAAGATCTARPEDTEVAPNGSLFIAFTSGSPSKSDGSPDARIFKGPKGETPYEYGWVMHLDEDGNDPAAMTFRWSMFATGGEPAEGGLGFANPDNLAFDAKGNVWVVTDMSGDKLNQAIPEGRLDDEGKPIKQSDLRAIYGNNSIWCIPTTGDRAGEALLFGFGPMDAELTGPYFTADQQTLFIAVQHPGEVNGVRQNMASETRKLALRTTDGQEFLQTREVPIGSNWPDKSANAAMKPSVIAIRRVNGSSIV